MGSLPDLDPLPGMQSSRALSQRPHSPSSSPVLFPSSAQSRNRLARAPSRASAHHDNNILNNSNEVSPNTSRAPPPRYSPPPPYVDYMSDVEVSNFARDLVVHDQVEAVLPDSVKLLGVVTSHRRGRAAIDYDLRNGQLWEDFIPSNETKFISLRRIPTTNPEDPAQPAMPAPTLQVSPTLVVNNPYGLAPTPPDLPAPTPPVVPSPPHAPPAATRALSLDDRWLVDMTPDPTPNPPQVPRDEWEELEYLQGDVLAEDLQLPGGDARLVGQPSHVAGMTGRDVVNLWVTDAGTPHLARLGVAKTTAQAHRRALRQLASMPEALRDLPLGKALVEMHTQLREQKKWQWSTTVTKMATTHGALRLLPLYSSAPYAILLKQDPTWVMAMRATGQKARQQHPNQPKAATGEQVRLAVDSCPLPAVKNALRLSWRTAGRGGDILLLRPHNVSVQGEILAVNFVRGKTAKVKGPYTVHTTLPPQEFLDYLEEAKKSGQQWLFPQVKGAHLKNALRVIDPSLEQRSLRRGAIQALAATGLSDEELLHYSGHSSVQMLRRYLNYGLKSGEAHQRAIRAAPLRL